MRISQFSIVLPAFLFVFELENKVVEAKSIILANYHNLLLFFPKEYGGNDDLRVIFDVRNVTKGTFKYMPVIVDVAYDSALNNAYCYLESAITSYIMLLKWAGGSWCYQVLFEFPSSQFSKYMYHSIVLVNNFVYWTTDRYIMSGRLPGFEKRVLLQPSWNRLYSMTIDRPKEVLYVAGFDYTENALFKCNLKLFSCLKLLTTKFTINDVIFNSFTNELFVASIQGGAEQNFLYRYSEDFDRLLPVNSIREEVANIIFLSDEFSIYTNQQSIHISSDINFPNTTRRALAKLLDPYALQYVFTFNQIANFDSYPYPYFFSDYHDLLYRNSLYLFYFYICGMDFVENDHVFLPQMDLNNQFLRIENCQTRFLNEREAYVIPTLIASCVLILIIVVLLVICFCQSKIGKEKSNKLKAKFKRQASLSLNKTSELFAKVKNMPQTKTNPVYDSYSASYKLSEGNQTTTQQKEYESGEKVKQYSLSGVFALPASSTPFETMTKTRGRELVMQHNFCDSALKARPIFQPPSAISSDNLPNEILSAQIFKDSTPTYSITSNDSTFHQVSNNNNNNILKSNRVKFNEYNVQHLYNKYDSPVIKLTKNIIDVKRSVDNQDSVSISSSVFEKQANHISLNNNEVHDDNMNNYTNIQFSTLPKSGEEAAENYANYIRQIDQNRNYSSHGNNLRSNNNNTSFNQYLDHDVPITFYDQF
jgi:hypothetical protein